MLGGNKEIQNGIIEVLGNDQENKFFENIKMLILKLGSLIRQNIDDEKAGKVAIGTDKFRITSVDNYDFYNETEKKMERKNVLEERTVDEAIYYQ